MKRTILLIALLSTISNSNASNTATWNYSDIGIPCLKAYGKISDCVWAAGYGWVYFENYSVFCAGSSITVVWERMGSCG